MSKPIVKAGLLRLLTPESRPFDPLELAKETEKIVGTGGWQANPAGTHPKMRPAREQP